MTWPQSNWDVDSGHSWRQPGERVLWEGGPDASVVFSKQDLFLVPFSLLWGGFAIFWEAGVTSTGWSFGTVWGVPFVAVGLYLIVGRFFYKRWDRRRTRYAITDKRAVLIRSEGRQVREADVATAPMQTERSRDGRHGSIIWTLTGVLPQGQRPYASWSGRMNTPAFLRGTGWPLVERNMTSEMAFLDVEDFDDLLQAVNQFRQPSPVGFGAPPPPPSFSEPVAWEPAPASIPEGERPWGRWPSPLVSVSFLVVGIVALVTTGILVVHRLTPYLDDPPAMSVPGATTLKLSPGTYVLFEHPEHQGRATDLCPVGGKCATFEPRDVTVTSAAVSHVTVVADTSSDRLTEHGATYPGVVEFTIPTAGRYRIDVASARSSNVVIDLSPGQEVHAYAGWIVVAGSSLLVVLASVVSVAGAFAYRRRLVASSSSGSPTSPGSRDVVTSTPWSQFSSPTSARGSWGRPQRIFVGVVITGVFVSLVVPTPGAWPLALVIVGVLAFGLVRMALRSKRKD
jgi:hypothetical protein